SGDSIFYNDKNEPAGIIFRVDIEGSSFPVVIEGVFGKNHTYAALSALAVAHSFKFNILEAVNAVKNHEVPPGRMRLLHGTSDSLIIDDTYNSSPFACEAALKTLGEIKHKNEHGRKIAILGDMLELGKHTYEAHKNIGKVAKENADILIVVGLRAKTIKEGAIEAGMKGDIFEFLDAVETSNFIKTFIQAGDIILIKGSQGMRMERIVETILLDQENKKTLLVRQDPEWLRKK
ncbi:MAG: glutamate ligase domain-containing protein, partial [Minisyncoccia bacterium]